MSVKGRVDVLTKWWVKGWVYEKFDSEPLSISIYNNEKLVCADVASIHRAGLQRKGLHQTGNCGFEIYIGNKTSFKKGDKITIKATDSENNIVPIKEQIFEQKPTTQTRRNKKDTFLVVGMGKSGTTAITYKIANTLNDPVINFEPGKHKGLLDVGLHKKITIKTPVITKSLFGKNLNVNFGAISHLYDRKIWIIRDPRDQLISIMLYQWFKGHKPNESKFKEALRLVRQKEQNPHAVSIKEIWALSANMGNFRENAHNHYLSIINIFENIKDNWFIFKYEDLIKENFGELETYLGFAIPQKEAELPDRFKRVARSKNYGNWKNWFTPDDVEFFKPIYQEILKYCGFDNDWELNASPVLDPEKGSLYMEKIFHKK